MGAFSIWHIVILGVIALVLFGGRGKVSDLMGDFGKGINSFKKGLSRTRQGRSHGHQRRNRRPRRTSTRTPPPAKRFECRAVFRQNATVNNVAHLFRIAL